MGSARAEEDSRAQKAKERIDGYQYIIDSAYVLFDGKYSMHDIETMPYKELLIKIEKEQELNRANEEEQKRREEEAAQEAQRLSRSNSHYMR